MRYKKYKSIWQRIGCFFDNHPLIEGTILAVLFPCVLFGIIFLLTFGINFLKESNSEKTKELYANKKIYTHIVEIEKITGLKDTVIFHDYDSIVNIHFEKGEINKPVIITTKSKNGLNIGINTEIKVEESINFKIVK